MPSHSPVHALHTRDPVSLALVPRLSSPRSSNQVNRPVRTSWAGPGAHERGHSPPLPAGSLRGAGGRASSALRASTPSPRPPGRTPTCAKSPYLHRAHLSPLPDSEVLSAHPPRGLPASPLPSPSSLPFIHSLLFSPFSLLLLPLSGSGPLSFSPSPLLPDVLSAFLPLHSSFLPALSAAPLPSFQRPPGFSVRRRAMPPSEPRAQSWNPFTARSQGPQTQHCSRLPPPLKEPPGPDPRAGTPDPGNRAGLLGGPAVSDDGSILGSAPNVPALRTRARVPRLG